ncbi:MAG: hypothetical protein EXR99_08505 [Gemmataceae bacterium]|nr:hypothetical protein [Gemmataceae bacterium]
MRKILILAALMAWFPASASADLFSYVKKPEACYAWKLKSKTPTPLGTVYELALTSQCWQGINWEHQIQVCVPPGAKPASTMLLWNQGGKASLTSGAFGLELARRAQAPCALLFGIPKQPLFEGKTEDKLIAETFVRFLETKDADWPLLFPMVKSLVKAMDALQEFTKEELKTQVDSFVVSGASKRGWTSWLTAAADKRVMAAVPLVIDTLNIPEQMPHQLKSYGKYSDMIIDYTSRGLVPLPDTKEARLLWSWVDPYFYRDQLTLPKLIINGANDPYWAVDALNKYWDGLKGDKWVLYVPNAGHNLEEKKADGKKDRERAIGALTAFAKFQIHHKTMPKLQWGYVSEGEGKKLQVQSDATIQGGRLWVAQADSLDFRKAKWVEQPASVKGKSLDALIPVPKQGCQACFGELDFEIDGTAFRLSTQMYVHEGKK